MDVFALTLKSRSATCIAILFANLAGTRDAGPLYSVLEQAAPYRLRYFSVRLSTPDDATARPDHTLWYTYPQYVDTCLRSPDFCLLKDQAAGWNWVQIFDSFEIKFQSNPKTPQSRERSLPRTPSCAISISLASLERGWKP